MGNIFCFKTMKSLPRSASIIPEYYNRSISYISLGFMAYFAVAAGPFGIEDAVRSAGSLPVIIAVCVLPFTWGMPQALMTAELSTMMSENGGYILWVRRGLGEFAGWVNAFNCIASNLCDLPTYPVLFASYVTAYLETQGYVVNYYETWGIKFIALLFVFVSNMVGIRAVAVSSIVMSLFVLAPFVVEPFVASDLSVKALENVNPNINWTLFLSTILWNYQGWDSLGCIAGEVRDSGRAYPLAILIALVLITFNYVVPVAVGVAIQPDSTLWKEGFLLTIANSISSWLGIWVGLAAIVATLGEFNVVMACSSRALWATSQYRMLPHCFTTESSKYNTPIAAVLFQSFTTCFLMSFEFGDLVILDTFFNNLTLLLEFMSYLRLKYTEPHTVRGFTVPFGNTGAWLITIPKVIVIFLLLFTQDTIVWQYGILFNLIVVISYLIWKKHPTNAYTPIHQ